MDPAARKHAGADGSTLTLELESAWWRHAHIDRYSRRGWGGAAFGGATANSSGRGNMMSAGAAVGPRTWARTSGSAPADKINARGFPGARVFVRPPRIQGCAPTPRGATSPSRSRATTLPSSSTWRARVAQTARGIPGLQNMEAFDEEASPILSVRLDPRARGYSRPERRVGRATLRTALDGTWRHGTPRAIVSSMSASCYRARSSPAQEDCGAVALFPAGAAGRSPVYPARTSPVSG